MTTKPEAINAMSAQPITSTIQPEAIKAPDLTPAAAWSRRVRRIGGLIQAAFAAFWLTRASLAIGGRTEDILLAASGVAVIGVFAYAIMVTAGTGPRPALIFPEMLHKDLVEEGWSPVFVDYFHFAFATAAAFSPTDVSAVKTWAKLMMMAESAISLVVGILVVARAVNILK